MEIYHQMHTESPLETKAHVTIPWIATPTTINTCTICRRKILNLQTISGSKMSTAKAARNVQKVMYNPLKRPLNAIDVTSILMNHEQDNLEMSPQHSLIIASTINQMIFLKALMAS